MDKRTFAKLMTLFDAETVEIMGDAKFAVEVVHEMSDEESLMRHVYIMAERSRRQ
jgi:hypothetical protein